MLKMLSHALVVAAVYTLSSSTVRAGESDVDCFGGDTKKITYPENAKRFTCGTQVGDAARAQMFENITVIGSPLILSTPAEVDAAEAQLGHTLSDWLSRVCHQVRGGRTRWVLHSHLPTSPHSWWDQQ